MLISIETRITCDFPGGSAPPIPPLDPHMLVELIEKKRDHIICMIGDKNLFATWI